MKLSNKDFVGTSWHLDIVYTTVKQLKEKVGNPQYECNDGSDKVNFDWTCETSNGDVFTIYDWKNYRPIDEEEFIEFHIGGFSKEVTTQAKKELMEILK